MQGEVESFGMVLYDFAYFIGEDHDLTIFVFLDSIHRPIHCLHPPV
jgi:hypothetical protein